MKDGVFMKKNRCFTVFIVIMSLFLAIGLGLLIVGALQNQGQFHLYIPKPVDFL